MVKLLICKRTKGWFKVSDLTDEDIDGIKKVEN
jgi:hypothetical protein